MLERETLKNLITVLGRLKDLKRRGWIKRNVTLPESDADHMFSTAFLTFMLTPDKLNRAHCLELALTHDLAEIYAGDATPGEKTAAKKYQDELNAVKRISQELEKPELIELFEEFENCLSREAAFVRCLDKADTVFTAAYYDNNNRSPEKLWAEFSAQALNSLKRVNSPYAEEIAELIKKSAQIYG